MLEAAERICLLWHELERPDFTRRYPNLDYDSAAYLKTAKERRLYISLDAGMSGYAVVDKRTGDVFASGAYGVPNRLKLLGNVLHDEPATIAARLKRR
jgi:hypothetical protein